MIIEKGTLLFKDGNSLARSLTHSVGGREDKKGHNHLMGCKTGGGEITGSNGILKVAQGEQILGGEMKVFDKYCLKIGFQN